MLKKVVVWLSESGVSVPCPACTKKIPLKKGDVNLTTVVCYGCGTSVPNPIGTTPVHIEVEEEDDKAIDDEGWEDVGLCDWEEIDALAATSDASSSSASSSSASSSNASSSASS